MEDTATKLSAIISKAMEAENYGRHFYLMAAASTADAGGKEAFERLAADELAHFEFLRRQLDSIAGGGKADGTLKLGKPPASSGGGSFFSAGLMERIGTAHFEMTALSVGIELELSAMNFYKSQSKSAKDAAARGFLKDLADWESSHYNLLFGQMEELKRDYWSGSGFEPY